MVRAERNNVPVSITTLLHMGANFGFLRAAFFRAVRRDGLTAEILPVVKPASATTSVIARSVDVSYSHISCCFILNYSRLPSTSLVQGGNNGSIEQGVEQSQGVLDLSPAVGV